MSVDSSLEWPPQQHFILVCLSMLEGARMQWEKDSGEARKTSKHLKTNRSLSLVFWIPLAYERQSLCFLKLPLKNLSIHFFILSQHVRPLDIWCPCQCPCSSFNCRWQLQSFRNGQASLVAQWLRICLPMQGTRVRALVWEDPTCRGATRPVSHNYWACASGACAPQQERPR